MSAEYSESCVVAVLSLYFTASLYKVPWPGIGNRVLQYYILALQRHRLEIIFCANVHATDLAQKMYQHRQRQSCDAREEHKTRRFKVVK